MSEPIYVDDDVLLNPRRWPLEVSDAWHRALPDVQAAFDALRAFRRPACSNCRAPLNDDTPLVVHETTLGRQPAFVFKREIKCTKCGTVQDMPPLLSDLRRL